MFSLSHIGDRNITSRKISADNKSSYENITWQTVAAAEYNFVL